MELRSGIEPGARKAGYLSFYNFSYLILKLVHAPPMAEIKNVIALAVGERDFENSQIQRYTRQEVAAAAESAESQSAVHAVSAAFIPPPTPPPLSATMQASLNVRPAA